MDLNEPVDFSERLRRKREELESKKPAVALTPPSLTQQFEADAPEIEPARSDEDQEIDRIISEIDILDAYRMWCGKSNPNPGGKREGIKVSCPNPAHPDKNPSAWVNLDKQTWYCGACDLGGDSYDIAAWYFGFPVPGYKTGQSFHELRRKIAESRGYRVQRTLGGQTLVVPSETEPITVPTPSLPAEQQPEAEETSVSTLSGPATEPDEWEDTIIYPRIDWRSFVPQGTFLWEWMQATSRDDLPEEYYFWLGLTALGLAIGRDVFLDDRVPVYGNMYICLIGGTGQGKSRAASALSHLLRTALPYDFSDPNSKGTKIVPQPGSAEALIDSFSLPVEDPTNPKRIAYYSPVRGLVRFDELATLVERSSRQGSAMKPTLMEFYDANPVVELMSRGAGHVKCENPFCASVTSTQPGVIRDLLTKQDLASGFMNRWLFVSGPPKRQFAWGGGDLVNIDASADLLRRVFSWSVPTRGYDLHNYPDALTEWDQFFHSYVVQLKTNDETGMLARLDLLFKKIILLLCANSLSEPTQEIVAHATGLLDYILAAYRIPAARIRASRTTECQDAIIGAIHKFTDKNNGLPPTMRDIRRSLVRRNYEAEFMNRVVKALIEAGEIAEVSYNDGKVGRPSLRYRRVS